MCDADEAVLRMMPLVYIVSGTRCLLVFLVFNFHVLLRCFAFMNNLHAYFHAKRSCVHGFSYSPTFV